MLKPIASWLAVALGLTGLASAQGAETLSEAELAAQLVAQFDRIHSPLGLGLIDVKGKAEENTLQKWDLGKERMQVTKEDLCLDLVNNTNSTAR